MSLNVKIASTVNRCRTAWALMMVCIAAWSAFTFPAWTLVLLLPFGFITYMGSLMVAALILTRTLSDEDVRQAEKDNALAEVKEKLATGNHNPEEVMQLMQEAGFTDVVVVEETGPVIGNYKDLPIYEFVLVKAPSEPEPQKFAYFGPADVVDGMPQIPVIEGKLFTHVEGILYSKEQPV